MNAFTVYYRDGVLIASRGFAELAAAVQFIGQVGAQFVALTAPQTKGIVHVFSTID